MLGHRYALPAVFAALPLALAACGDKTPSDPRTDAPLVRAATVQGAVSYTHLTLPTIYSV